MQRVWVQSLVRELRSQALASPDHKTKTQNRSNIVTNSVKTFKWSTSKILKKKKGREGSLRIPMPTSFHILQNDQRKGCAISLLPSSLKRVDVGGGRWVGRRWGCGLSPVAGESLKNGWASVLGMGHI